MRRLVLSALLAAGLLTTSAVTATAAPVPASVHAITACLAQRGDAPHISLADAQACAPGASYITTAHGVIIAVAAPTVTQVRNGTSCAFYQWSFWDSGLTDSMGAWFCWNGGAVWYNGGARRSCNSSIPTLALRRASAISGKHTLIGNPHGGH